MLDPLSEKLISIPDAAKRCGASGVHVSTVWRWLRKGVRGHQLESTLVGGHRYTSAGALETFFEKLNSEEQNPLTEPKTSNSHKRSKQSLLQDGLIDASAVQHASDSEGAAEPHVSPIDGGRNEQ